MIASVHLFEGKLDDEPIHLWLSFEDLALFRLFGASDGWSLGVDRILPEPTDMGESGEIILVDVSNKTTFGKTIGRESKGAWLAESPAGETIGVHFGFGFSLRPIVINWGDELRIADDYPPDARGKFSADRPPVEPGELPEKQKVDEQKTRWAEALASVAVAADESKKWLEKKLKELEKQLEEHSAPRAAT